LSRGRRPQPPTQPEDLTEMPSGEGSNHGPSVSAPAQQVAEGPDPTATLEASSVLPVEVSTSLLILLISAFALVVIRNAWIGDDAYITLRTVDNFVHGYGLRWNVDERVQAYTHPLWTFLLALGYALTREGYYTTLALSILLSVATVVVFALGIARRRGGILLGLTILALSKAFVDYSSSGLENPLTHLLFALYWFTCQNAELKRGHLLRLSIIAGLATLNRLDTILLFAPSLLHLYWRFPKLKGLGIVALGFSPLIAWEAFSLFYYGFPFPNTAYAKLNTGIGGLMLMRQAGYYLLDSLNNDPVTLLIVATALGSTVIAKNWKKAPLAAGIALYLLYVLRIGGDFMSGRFLSAPLLGSVFLLAQQTPSILRPQDWLGWALVVIIGCSSPASPLTSGAEYKRQSIENGIADERGYYYPDAGLLRARSDGAWPHNREVEKVPTGLLKDMLTSHVLVWPAVGILGYEAGPSIHIVDHWALADALLARLPATYTPRWRVGHYQRTLPAGYVETLTNAANVLSDPKLAAYYDALSLVTRGPLFSFRRLVAIWRMNTGQYEHLIDQTAYRYPGQAKAKLADLGRSKTEGAAWDEPGNQVMSETGIVVDLGRRWDATVAEVSLDGNDTYQVAYLLGGREVAQQVVHPRLVRSMGLGVHRLVVPVEASRKGYDEIRILPLQGDGCYSLGHLRLSGL